MENTITTEQKHTLSFHGSGGAFFGIIVVNWLLTIITLGFYYPWAKAKQLQYIYGSVSLNNDNFSFHGTGKEMFKGFIKAIALFILVYGLLIAFAFLGMPIIGGIIFYIAFLAIMPIAIHGAYRYRMSRTSWRGIRFGYRGTKAELVKLFFKGIFFTIITLGIYGACMV